MESQRIFLRRRFSVLTARAIGAAVPLLGVAIAGAAAPNFTSGSATWSWDADTASAAGGKTVFAITPPAASSIGSAFQLNKIGTAGAGTATGKGAIGYITNSTTASFTLTGGTGSSQADPNDDFPGQTITKVQFSGLFTPTAPSFGPTATGYVSITVAGTAGINGYTQVAGDFNFRLNDANGATLRSPISFGDTFNGGAAPTPFGKTYTYCSALSPSTLSPAQKIFVSGSLTFISSNLGSPSDIIPLQVEAGGAPPTATFFGASGSNWGSASTWAQPDDPQNGISSFLEPGALVPAVPNGVGQRARFVNVGSGPRSISLANAFTVGALSIDDDDALTINGGSASLIMDVPTGEATIYAGAAIGEANHSLDVMIHLADSLDIRTESATPGSDGGTSLDFSMPIDATGAPADVNIQGGGVVQYSAANDYAGATNINDRGRLIANADGCLGTGSVNVSDGRLKLNVTQPAAPGGGSISIGDGGVVELAVPNITGVNLNIGAGGGLAGSGSILSSLIVNNGGSINLADGATILHTDGNFSANPQGLSNFPVYILAVQGGGTVAGPVDVGVDAAGPYYGIAGTGNTTFGASPTDPNAPLLTIVELAPIFARGGTFAINNRLAASIPQTVAEIRGNGIVSIDSQFNPYDGQLNVMNRATLRVNGLLPNVQAINVFAGGMFGGEGAVGGLVDVSNGGVLDPGIGPVDNVTGTLDVNNLSLSPGSILDFEFGGAAVFNDSINVAGNLTLDGVLQINQLQDIGLGTYTLFNVSGSIIDNGLAISPMSQQLFAADAGTQATIVVMMNGAGPGGVVLLRIVPEPASAGVLAAALLIAARRRR